MIKRLIVKNLNGRFDFDLTFHRDLNILVGQNGCGKTSLLKLMWYVYSGNIYRLPFELVFDNVRLETFSGDSIELKKDKFIPIFPIRHSEKIHISLNNKELGAVEVKDLSRISNGVHIGDSVSKFANIAKNNSVFMPTFRRIEGGLATQSFDIIGLQVHPLDASLRKLSDNLTVKAADKSSHTFVTSVSSRDIVNLITSKYSDISEGLRKIEDEQSESIIHKARANNGEQVGTDLEEIVEKIEANNKKRKELLSSMTTLSNFVKKIIKNKKIQLTEKLYLGEGEEILPDKLSFGEKQMLSFLCYNFFADNSIIFMDEPEMSLHVDWQRILFPVLMEQNTTNQFIVATHSPFIYAQYQDKQIELKQQELVTV